MNYTFVFSLHSAELSSSRTPLKLNWQWVKGSSSERIWFSPVWSHIVVALKQSWAGCCFCNAAPPCSPLTVSSTNVSCPAVRPSHSTFGCWHVPVFFLSSVWSLLTVFTLLESSSALMLGFTVCLITIDYEPETSGVHGDSSTFYHLGLPPAFCVYLCSQSTKPLAHLPPVHPTCRSPSFLLFPRLSFPMFTSFLEFVLLLHLPATLSYRQKEQLGLKRWPGNTILKEPLLFQLTSRSGTLQDLSLATCVRSPRVLLKNKKPNAKLEYSSIKQ